MARPVPIQLLRLWQQQRDRLMRWGGAAEMPTVNLHSLVTKQPPRNRFLCRCPAPATNTTTEQGRGGILGNDATHLSTQRHHQAEPPSSSVVSGGARGGATRALRVGPPRRALLSTPHRGPRRTAGA